MECNIDATARSRLVNLVWLVPAHLSIDVRENRQTQNKEMARGGARCCGCEVSQLIKGKSEEADRLNANKVRQMSPRDL